MPGFGLFTMLLQGLKIGLDVLYVILQLMLYRIVSMGGIVYVHGRSTCTCAYRAILMLSDRQSSIPAYARLFMKRVFGCNKQISHSFKIDISVHLQQVVLQLL